MEVVRVCSPQLQLKAPHLIHTSYYKTFFLLRTEVAVNGELAQVGVDDRGWLTLYSRKQAVGVTFDSLVTDVNDVLQRHWLHGVSNYWCEEVPLFELRGTSQEELDRLLGLKGGVWEELASKISERMRALLPREKDSAAAASDRSFPHVTVQPQLYMVIPDYEDTDGRPVLVTRANFSDCMTQFGKSNLFDFGAIFRESRTGRVVEDTGPASLAVLHAELYEVVNWYGLGQALLVPDYELLTFRQDYPHNTAMCRSAVLSYWWKNGETTWRSLIQALAKCGQYRLATTIANRYGIPVPHRKRAISPSPPAFQEQYSDMEEIAALQTLIAKLRTDIEVRNRELAKLDRRLQKAEKERNVTARQIETLRHQLWRYQSTLNELDGEKEHMANTLTMKQFEVDLLRQGRTQQVELQRLSIEQKEREISDLNRRLQTVERELDDANKQIPTLRESLEWVTVELARKSAEVELAREGRNDGRLLLDMANKVLDTYLIQQSAANVSYNRYVEEVEMHHINLKENSEMSTREYEAFHKLLEKDDPQLGPLFQKISSRNPEQSMAYKSTTKLPLPPDTQSNTVTGAAAAVSRGDFQAKLNRTLSPTFKKGVSPAPKEGIDANEDLVSVLSCLQWEKMCTAPQALVRGSAAVHDQTIFVIGENSNTIHRYNTTENQWSTLPVACPHVNPGLVFVKGLLTAVGGQRMGLSTSRVVSLKNNSEWEKELPMMNHPHSSPSVHNHDGNYLIVATRSWEAEESGIELYSIHTAHWFNVITLPKPFYSTTSITSTLCHDTYTVMDGAGNTYSTDLSSLLSFSTGSECAWTTHTQLSVQGKPTLATFNEKIVCVSSEGLHQLCEGQGWVKVRNTFSSLSLWSKSIVCVVSERMEAGERLVVIGGYSPCKHYTTAEVSIAQ